MDYRQTSSASRQTPAEHYSSRAPGTARPARAADHRHTRLRDHAIGRDLYDQQIAARCPYQLKHKDGPNTDGYQRLSSPPPAPTPG